MAVLIEGLLAHRGGALGKVRLGLLDGQSLDALIVDVGLHPFGGAGKRLLVRAGGSERVNLAVVAVVVSLGLERQDSADGSRRLIGGLAEARHRRSPAR